MPRPAHADTHPTPARQRSARAHSAIAGLLALTALTAVTLSACAADPEPNMGDASETRADQVPSARLSEGPFALLDTRPVGSDAAAGTAWLARSDRGTTVTVELTGLTPGQQYMAHVHTKGCAQDAGGPHFRFDPDGPEEPPNEIHLAFTAEDSGNGFMTAQNDRTVGDDARSVVIHAMGRPLACAELQH